MANPALMKCFHYVQWKKERVIISYYFKIWVSSVSLTLSRQMSQQREGRINDAVDDYMVIYVPLRQVGITFPLVKCTKTNDYSVLTHKGNQLLYIKKETTSERKRRAGLNHLSIMHKNCCDNERANVIFLQRSTLIAPKTSKAW